jgi:hypothetical protein
MADLFSSPRSGRIVAEYNYTDARGSLLYQILRKEPKGFTTRVPKAKGGWEYKLNGSPRVPYKLPELLASNRKSPVYIVEGEKDADTLTALGLVSSCNVFGAGKWLTEYNEHFRGRQVIIIPDNDKPGRQHAEEVAANLHGIARSVRVVELPGLSEHGDVSDWLAGGGDRKQLSALARKAKAWQPVGDVGKEESKAASPKKGKGTESRKVSNGYAAGTESRKVSNEYLEPLSLADGMKAFGRWLEITDPYILEVVLGVAATAHLSGDPCWLIVVDASSSGKTEALRPLLDHPNVTFLSSLTTSTLISGFRRDGDDKDESLLADPKLQNGILVIKDLTPILEMNGDKRREIFSQLRDAYDGVTSKGFGRGGIREYRVKFTVIAACTPVIEQHVGSMQAVGERFLRYQPQSGNQRAKIDRAVGNTHREEKMREELSTTAQRVLAGASKKPPRHSKQVQKLLVNLAHVLAVARTEVARNGYTKEISYMPLPEVGSRVVKQLLTLMQGVAMLNQHATIGPHEFCIAQRVAADTLPSKRRSILRVLSRTTTPVTADHLRTETKLPLSTLRYSLEDMELLGIVEHESEVEGKATTMSYRLTGEFRELIGSVKKYTGLDFP